MKLKLNTVKYSFMLYFLFPKSACLSGMFTQFPSSECHIEDNIWLTNDECAKFSFPLLHNQFLFGLFSVSSKLWIQLMLVFCFPLVECLQQYVQLAILEGGGSPITCPDMSCQKTGMLLDSEVRPGLNRHMQVKSETPFIKSLHTFWCIPFSLFVLNAARSQI